MDELWAVRSKDTRDHSWSGPEKNLYKWKTRKLMTMHKALYPRYDVDRLFVSRKERRGIFSIKNSVDASIQWLEDYIEKRGGRLITKKTTLWTFYATKKQRLPRENVNMAKEEKS